MKLNFRNYIVANEQMMPFKSTLAYATQNGEISIDFGYMASQEVNKQNEKINNSKTRNWIERSKGVRIISSVDAVFGRPSR